MTQYLKGIGALVIAFVIVAVANKTLPLETFHDMTFVFSER